MGRKLKIQELKDTKRNKDTRKKIQEKILKIQEKSHYKNR
jgi:hypothetical protein